MFTSLNQLVIYFTYISDQDSALILLNIQLCFPTVRFEAYPDTEIGFCKDGWPMNYELVVRTV
jgi:hypothetical protein